MHLRARISGFPVFLATLAAFGISTSAQQDIAKDEFAWRVQHAANLQKPDGWLSLIGLEWIEPGEITIGSAADNKIHLPASTPAHLAILRYASESVTIAPPKDGFPAGLQVDGAPAKEQVLRADQDKDKFNSHVTVGTINFYVIRRAEKFALRIKDANSPSLQEFHGLKWFEPNAAFQVIAKWTPYNPAKSISLITLVGTSYSQPVPGYAEFSLDGKKFRIEPVLEDPKGNKLFFILRDTTSTENTYPACRFLYTPLPDHGIDQPGELVLDFNHLENPPCAYTPYATCPLPPAGNRLPIALPVGEQRYHK
jgi:uncharacterized protein (DUF1684 family)